MGALVKDYINQPSNNSSYTGTGLASSRTSINTPSPSVESVVAASGEVIGDVLSIAGMVLPVSRPYKVALELAGEGIKRFTREEKEALSKPEQNVVEQGEALQKAQENQSKILEEITDSLEQVSSNIKYEQGNPLPEVMTNNMKSLADTLSIFVTSFNEQFSLMNNYLMAGLIYQQQFLDLKMTESALLQDYYQFLRTQQTVKDSRGNTVSSLAPREARAYKDSYAVESFDYQKVPMQVKDIDENVLFDIPPREVKTVMHSTVAKDTTDKINFELPEDTDDDTISPEEMNFIKACMGYGGESELTKSFINGVGGSVS